MQYKVCKGKSLGELRGEARGVGKTSAVGVRAGKVCHDSSHGQLRPDSTSYSDRWLYPVRKSAMAPLFAFCLPRTRARQCLSLDSLLTLAAGCEALPASWLYDSDPLAPLARLALPGSSRPA